MPIPLPALDVKAPQIESPMDAYGKALSVQSLIQGNQMQSMQLQQAQQDQKDRQLFRQELANNNGDLGKTAQAVKSKGGSLEMVLKLENASLQHRQQIAATTDSELGVQKKYADFENSAIDAVKKAPADKKAEVWQAGRATLAQLPGYDLTKIPQDYPGDEQVDLLSTLHMGHTEALKEQLDQRKVAAEETASNARMIQAQNSGKEGELPLGQDRVAQYNDLFKQRYAVLNPTKDLPSTYQLPATATQKDFDRVDKMLESTEKAVATKAQQDTVNEIRKQTTALQNPKFGSDDAMVDLVGTGKMDLATATSRMNAATKDNFVKAVAAKYGDTFKQSTYGVEKKVEEAFTSGQYSQQLNSINRARNHMGTFLKLAEAMNNGDVKVINSVSNFFKEQFGSSAPGNLQIAKQAFASEVGKSFAGANVALHDREELDKSIDKASSWTQLSDAAKTADELLGGAQKALKETYDAGKQGKPNFGDNGKMAPDASQGKFSVTAPNGKTYNFPDQAALDAFKAKAGIK